MSHVTRSSTRLIVLLLLVAALPALAAELRFSRAFSDHMVLQRDKPITLRGMAAPGAAVTVSLGEQRAQAQADDAGVWTATLPATPANASGQTLSASDGTTTATLNDVLLGDVILMARQTAIDVTLASSPAGAEAATTAGSGKKWRAIRIGMIPAVEPQADLAAGATSGWAVVDPAVAAEMTASAYYLGRDLAASSEVPVGIVDLNMGYQFPIAWLSREALDETEKFYGKSDVPGQLQRRDKLVALEAAGEPMPPKEAIRSDVVSYPIFPAGGYNAVIHPLRGLGLRAVVLQIGGNYPYMLYDALRDRGKHLDRPALNDTYVQTYDIRKVGFRMDPVTTPRLPREWRAAFGDAALPVGLVMAPGSDLQTLAERLMEMRELQRRIAGELDGVGLILPGMENVPFSVQPSDEALIAARSLQWLRGAAFDVAGVVPSGPVYERLETHLNEATIYFQEGTAEGLRAEPGALDYFEVAGVDLAYAPATATIDGTTIRLETTEIPRIVHVRYNWNARPNQGLVNAAGLPAVPFRTEEAAYKWFFTHADNDLPPEYSLPANEWEGGDVTLVSGQVTKNGYEHFTGWLGPVGVKVGPFGPNMVVNRVLPGSPADGLLLEGDVIYRANGTMLGDDHQEHVMAAAITASETRKLGGKLVLDLRRGSEDMTVTVTLDVMGSYSGTYPYDCPKSETIVNELVAWVVARDGDTGYLGSDALFLLGTGDPELQGLVRRMVYATIADVDLEKEIDPTKGPKAWYPAWESVLVGEYYLATGDKAVLPYLKYYCDLLAAKQHPEGGWRHNFPGGDSYGLLPAIGVPAMLGMQLALESGVEIDMQAYQRGMDFFRDGAGDAGRIIYGVNLTEYDPAPIDPADMAAGMLSTSNGALGAAAILFGLSGDLRAAHICSLISTYSYNNTFHGHGGNFWNNFWTPLGAAAHSKPAFLHFMQGHQWYREMNRMYDGSLIITEGGYVGAGTGLALLVPRQRLVMTGAPRSPFAATHMAELQPALDAYWARDYAGSVTLVEALLDSGTVGKKDRPTVEKLAQAGRDMQASIAADLDRLQMLIDEGRVYEATRYLPQLEAVVPAGHAGLAAITATLKDAKPREDDQARYQAAQKALIDVTKQEAAAADADREWVALTTEVRVDEKKDKDRLGKVDDEVASIWRLKVVEDLSQAPEGWNQPGFDASAWDATTLPISWHLNHTALLRTTFQVEDKSAYDLLRFRSWLFRQQGIEIYLNGKLIGRVNNIEGKTGDLDATFNDGALAALQNGENTLAIATRHNWRWGMLFMRVYNDGYGFMLDARKR